MEPQRATGPTAARLQWPGPETAPVSSQPPPDIAPPIAALRGVGRTFDDVVALTGVDLAIERGSIVGVIGPSGAGKTTAIRLLTGALRPTSGEAEVLGGDPTRLPAETRARIGFMPQHVSLYDDLTVGENLDFVASLYGLFLFRRRARIRALLDWLELTDARKRRAGDLSGGMRRRLQLACALVHDPELVFLDEPTAGIDPLVRQSIWRELHRLREAGRTLLITTQYVPEAEECDVVALIAEGRLIAFDTPEALRQRAFGGQLLEIETSDPIDVDRLATRPRGRGRPAARAAAAAGPQPGLEDDRAGGDRGRRGPGRHGDLDPRGPAVVRRGVRAARPRGRGVRGLDRARPIRRVRGVGADRRVRRGRRLDAGPVDGVAGATARVAPEPDGDDGDGAAEPALPEALSEPVPEALSEPVPEAPEEVAVR